MEICVYTQYLYNMYSPEISILYIVQIVTYCYSTDDFEILRKYAKHNQSVDLVEGCTTHGNKATTSAWWAHSHSTSHPTPISLHQCLPHHSTQNIPPLIGLCSSNMFVMKKQHIILSLLAGRAQFTKVEVGDKQRQYGCGVLRTMNHPSARVEQNIIESNISEHFHHN